MEPILPAEVQSLLSQPFTDPDILSAIDEATVLLGQCGEAYEPARRRIIIRYLAGHLLASRLSSARGNLKSESVDGTSYTTNTAQVGMGLRGTSLGQMALNFDIRNCLADIDARPVVFMAL